MTSSKELGNIGEELAKELLIKKGYTIKMTNYRYQKYELDIIAEKGNTIIFIEVKTRTYDTVNSPEDAVNSIKKGRIIEAANHYLESNNIQKEARFDIISIIINQQKKSIHHIEDAFNSIF